MADLPNLANHDYVVRINRAIDHITRNVANPLPLDEIARAAAFSPFHFHRIFRALVGETVHAFVKRVRLERAVTLMSQRPDASLTDIALATGFAGSSDFSRSFRAHFGVPPSAFDVEAFREARRNELVAKTVPDAPHRLEGLPPGANPDNFVPRILTLPLRRVAYARANEPYTSGSVVPTVQRMLAWARERGLAGGQWLGYMWEDPKVVAVEDCHYDIGVVVPDTADTTGANVTSFPEMTVVELDMIGGIDLEMRALDYLYRTWLPTSGYVPDHQPGFEAFIGEPFAHGTEHFELRVQLAIVPATTPL
ncbi:MAG: AraC family transcriptional regulator [Deltaproteobacteria bacterium]|nr:AraC family transcriptional regulator [Deltaproteobacteria bacterium]